MRWEKLGLCSRPRAMIGGHARTRRHRRSRGMVTGRCVSTSRHTTTSADRTSAWSTSSRTTNFESWTNDGPILSPGTVGLFDDSGVAVGSVVRRGDADYLFYMGWNLRVTVRGRTPSGWRRTRPHDQFVRFGRVPIGPQRRGSVHHVVPMGIGDGNDHDDVVWDQHRVGTHRTTCNM